MAFSMRTDPRIRQSFNQLSSNFESATENARVGCFAFSQAYLEPLYHSIADCCQNTTNSCIPDRRRRRRREFPFDFYNEDLYDEDTNDFMGWGNDELDRLLAGSGPNQRSYGAPSYGPPPGMFYHNSGNGGRSNSILRPPPRRKSAVVPHDGGPDPTIIPNTSALGFLSRIPFMRSTLRYQPSAADLQEHPGRHDEHQNLLGHRRRRSNTASSGETSDSMRSRADLFPSEDEEDAVPLGDEFDIGLRSSGTSETSLAATKSKRKKKGRQLDLGSPRSGRSKRRGSDRTNGSSIRSSSGFASPSSDNEGYLSHDAISIEEQLAELIDDEPSEDAHAFPPYESSGHDALFSETTKPFPKYKDHGDNLSASERRSIHTPTSPALSARSFNANKQLPPTPDVDLFSDETLLLNRDALPPKEFPARESSRIAIVPAEIRQATVTKEHKVAHSEEEEIRSLPGKTDEASDLESDSTLKVTLDDSDIEPSDATPRKSIVKKVELRSAVQSPVAPVRTQRSNETPSRPSIPTVPNPTEKQLAEAIGFTSPTLFRTAPITIPNNIPHYLTSPPRSNLSKSYTAAPTTKESLLLSLPHGSLSPPLSKSLSSWTWCKLEEWFPPLPKDNDWMISRHARNNSGGYNGRNVRNPEEDAEWRGGMDDMNEEGVAETWRRSIEVLRDDGRGAEGGV